MTENPENTPQNYYPSLFYDTVSQRLNIICITNCGAVLNCTFKVHKVIAELPLNLHEQRNVWHLEKHPLYFFFWWMVIFCWGIAHQCNMLSKATFANNTINSNFMLKLKQMASATYTWAFYHRDNLNLFLTLSYGLVFVISQRGNEEAHLRYRTPVMQDADVPHTGPQRLVERWAIVGKLGACINQNVISGCDDVGRVDPHNRDGDIRPFNPLLHAHRLIHGTH